METTSGNRITITVGAPVFVGDGWESGFPLFIQSFGDRALEEKIHEDMANTLTEWVQSKQ